MRPKENPTHHIKHLHFSFCSLPGAILSWRWGIPRPRTYATPAIPAQKPLKSTRYAAVRSLYAGPLADECATNLACDAQRCFSAPTLPLGLLAAGKLIFAPALVILGFGMANSATAVYTPLLTAALFGQKNYSRTYSKINALGYLFGAVTPVIYGKIYTVFGSYCLSYCLFTAVFLIGAVSLWVIEVKH